MALFQKVIRQYGRPGRNRHVKQVTIIKQHVTRLPEFMKRLSRLCHGAAHILPVRMKFLAEATSDAGQPMAIYRCGASGCRYREGWVVDRHTGRPLRLWAGLHDGR
jgi:hypothetical protein